ncbi:polysaccharide biosynthesis/export family protein [Anaerovibrio slackiae]|nr:polysaccharide biosynthesis/export family protein [Anaerovibrio slackiae]
MKKIAALTAGILLGINLGCIVLADAMPRASAKVENAVESLDESIFKVARMRPERMLEEYRLMKYDTINIMAIGFPNGIGVNDVTVGVDGMVRLPYTGNLKLVGLTLDEARDLIHEKLSRYFKLPELNVYMKSYGPRKVYVMGNVNAPGIKEMGVDNMNVYAAVSAAGGVDRKGRSKHVQLIRQIDGVLYYREINLDAFVKKHDMSQNIALEDGDIVYVPDSGKIIFSEDIAPYINLYATYRTIVRD